jgi:hypothetical protein
MHVSKKGQREEESRAYKTRRQQLFSRSSAAQSQAESDKSMTAIWGVKPRFESRTASKAV